MIRPWRVGGDHIPRSGLGGDLREHLQPFPLPQINQKHDHLSAGLKHEAATFFYLIGFDLSPSTRYQMYQKHLVGVHNGADRTQVKLLPPSAHISRFSPPLQSLSILFLGNSYSPSKTQLKCVPSPEALPATLAEMVLPTCFPIIQDTLLLKPIRILHIRVQSLPMFWAGLLL